jgi:hypothetical protein
VRQSEKDWFASPVPRDVHAHREQLNIPMAGIPQIPEAADRHWKRFDFELPTHLQRQCDEIIAEAMLEHRRRREAAKQGIDLADYWPDDGSDDCD